MVSIYFHKDWSDKKKKFIWIIDNFDFPSVSVFLTLSYFKYQHNYDFYLYF